MIVKLLLLPHKSHFVLVVPKRERNETIAVGDLDVRQNGSSVLIFILPQTIIEEINNRTGNNFDKDVAAQSMLQIKEILLKSQKLQQSALVNSEDEFKFSYFDDIDDALVQGLEQNQDFFSMLLANPEIKKQVLGIFVTEVYKTLKNKL